MTRFFVSSEQISDDTAWLEGEDARHCCVLRLAAGECVTLCDGLGIDYDCTVVSVTRDRTVLAVCGSKVSVGEPKLYYQVYCAYPKGDKAEQIVQKCTELGAAEIGFFPSKYCIAKYDGKEAAKKRERWQKVAREAAQQSQRGIIPEVRTFASIREAFTEGSRSDLPLFCYEAATKLSLFDTVNGNERSIAIVTGSEGGFAEDEAELAVALGYKCITLGTRILRCETAPMAVLAALTLR